jgi:predicted AAA+ superfamily ATPase
MFGRSLKISKSMSFLLFGARGTGKSTLLKALFPQKKPADAFFIDLLQDDEYVRFSTKPGLLGQVVEGLPKTVQWVIIDEVQKVPKLLDEVHRQIFSKRVRFALTGSSARKLKRGQANLLAGRALVHHLYPLTEKELGKTFDLAAALSHGTLPDVIPLVTLEERAAYLRAYVSTYLKEEIVAEQVVRKMPPFLRFLPTLGQMNGEIINYSRMARDAGVDDMTVRSYFSILEDTLIGFFLEPYHHSIRKRQRESSKFYLFDTGVARSLQGMGTAPLVEGSSAYGKAFEHFVILEIRRRAEYLGKEWRYSYLRTSSESAEIDLIIERPGDKTVLLEIKSSRLVSDTEIHRLQSFKKDFAHAEAFVFSHEPVPRKVNGVDVFPWSQGLAALGI